MALLSFEEVSAITYRETDIIIRLNPEQQSLLVQAIAIFNDSEQWSDYDTYGDDIDALVAASEYALQVEDDGGSMLDIDAWSCNGAGIGGGLTYFNAAFMPFNFAMFTGNTANLGIRNEVWLKAGEYSYVGWYSKSSSSGITDVNLEDEAGSVYETIQANIDQYNASFNLRFQAAGSFTIPEDGFYWIACRNEGTKNASSSGYNVNWTSHHIKQTS